MTANNKLIYLKILPYYRKNGNSKTKSIDQNVWYKRALVLYISQRLPWAQKLLKTTLKLTLKIHVEI